MTEAQAQYDVIAKYSTDPVKCPKCGRVKGFYQRVGDQIWLARDGEVVRVLRSICACGEEFNFMASEKRLEDLIERLKNV